MEDLGDPVDANKMVQRRPAAPLRRGAVLYGIRTVNLVGQGVDFIAFHSGPVLLILLRLCWLLRHWFCQVSEDLSAY